MSMSEVSTTTVPHQSENSVTRLIESDGCYMMSDDNRDFDCLRATIAKCLRDKLAAGSTVELAIGVLQCEVGNALEQAFDEVTGKS